MTVKRIIIALLSVVFLGSADIQAQEEGFFKELEIDISASPKAIVADESINISSNKLAVRYRCNDNLSIGIGTALAHISISDLSASYVPFYLSTRYGFTPDNKVSPYSLVNVGASVFGNDVLFQAGIAAGINISLADNCSMFLEIGLGYLADESFWSPISIGIRL